MNKAQYLQALRDALAGRISEAELRNVLEYYSEYFDDSGDDEATAAALGDPKTLAEEIVAQQGLPVPRKRPRRKRRWLFPVVVVAVVLVMTALAAAVTYFRHFSDWNSHSSPGKFCIDTDIGAMQSIDIDTNFADIELVAGKQWHVYLAWPKEKLALKYYCEDGTLYIRSHGSGKVNNVLSGSTVVVTVPRDCLLQRLSVHTDLGTVTLSDAEASRAKIGTNLGEINLQNCAFKTLVCDNSLGNITARKVAGVTFQCDADLGDVNLHGCEYDDITVNLDMGSATLTDLPSLASHHEVCLDTSLGDIHVNHVSHKHSYHHVNQGGTHGGDHHDNSHNSAYRTLTVNNSLGDINVSFDD